MAFLNLKIIVLMRKTIFLFFSLIAVSCSNSSDSNSSNSSSINPPTWIRGVWIQEGSTLGNGYIFTSDDFLLKGLSGNTSFKQAIQSTIASGGNASATETISSEIYNISITIGAQTTDYNFQKVSATKIEWMNGPTSDHYYFIKQ